MNEPRIIMVDEAKGFFDLPQRNHFFCYICTPLKGRMAERLGTGLQNPLQRFESASDLFHQTLLRSVWHLNDIRHILIAQNP